MREFYCSERHRGDVTCVDCSGAHGGIVVSGGLDGLILVHQAASGILLRKWTAATWGVAWLQIDINGRTLSTRGADSQDPIERWLLETGERLEEES